MMLSIILLIIHPQTNNWQTFTSCSVNSLHATTYLRTYVCLVTKTVNGSHLLIACEKHKEFLSKRGMNTCSPVV